MKYPVKKALELLEGAEERAGRIKALVGLDGFVDTIIRVVDKRISQDEFESIQTLESLSRRIGQAAGRSANLELVCEMEKIGGNGPIMANALATCGIRIRYIGNLGHPKIHSVFAGFSKRCEVISIAEPCHTDALEFTDGKLMLTRPRPLFDLTWKNLKKKIGEDKLLKFFQESSFIALNNWTQIPFMSEIWEEIQKSVAPKLTGEKRTLFFDLADPQKRVPEDVLRGMKLIEGFESTFRTVLGLNESEALQIAKVLGIKRAPKESLAELASRIRGKLKISIVVIHPREYAVAADESVEHLVEGPFCAKPLISTGAGDHFNAGFCLGLMIGGSLESALQLGVATSGFYVRTAKSPTVADLRKFLKEV